MSYVQSVSAQEIDPEILLSVTKLLGLRASPDELKPLAATLAAQLALVTLLDDLDLADLSPITVMDPRWHE